MFSSSILSVNVVNELWYNPLHVAVFYCYFLFEREGFTVFFNNRYSNVTFSYKQTIHV